MEPTPITSEAIIAFLKRLGVRWGSPVTFPFLKKDARRMTTLVVGSKYFLKPAPLTATLYDTGEVAIASSPIPMLYDPRSAFLRRYAEAVLDVEIGFNDVLADIGFLEHLPNVRRVWVLTSDIKDITGLRYLNHLTNLAIDRPTCRMDVLGELSQLEELSLDDWRPGAATMFRLSRLETLLLRRFPYKDVENLRHMDRLRTLWLTHGALETLTGLPSGVTQLELAGLRKLQSIKQLSQLPSLERLIIQSCRSLTSVIGVEASASLKFLSVFDCNTVLESLQPIRNLRGLTYLVLTGFRGIIEPDESVFDHMQQLEMLIISRKLGVPLERLTRALPNTEIRYVR